MKINLDAFQSKVAGLFPDPAHLTKQDVLDLEDARFLCEVIPEFIADQILFLLDSKDITLDSVQGDSLDHKIHHAIDAVVNGMVRAIRVVIEQKLDEAPHLDFGHVGKEKEDGWNIEYRRALSDLLQEGEVDLCFAEDHHLFESCIYQAITGRLIQRLFFEKPKIVGVP